jgi:hypothetical protein
MGMGQVHDDLQACNEIIADFSRKLAIDIFAELAERII